MILKSFGCSFIFGNELADDGRDTLYATSSKFTWPALAAKHYDWQYQTYARPGSGNLQILERLLSHFAGATNDNVFCVIGWSWIDRFDYCTELSSWPGQPWATIMPVDSDALAKMYYKKLHSEIKDKLVSLLYIRQAIDFLKGKQIPFLMTYMDHLLFDTRWNTTPAITDLQNYVKPYMTQFDGLNFQEWSRQNQYPISTQGHPLEQAHLAASKYMLRIINDRCKQL